MWHECKILRSKTATPSAQHTIEKNKTENINKHGVLVNNIYFTKNTTITNMTSESKAK